jgi:hypothetical protein
VNQPRAIWEKEHYFIGQVTIRHSRQIDNNKAVPLEYWQHGKLFSKIASQHLPQDTIWDYTIELLPRALATLPGRLLPLTQDKIVKCHQFMEEHL